jgi:hypothetical protein
MNKMNKMKFVGHMTWIRTVTLKIFAGTERVDCSDSDLEGVRFEAQPNIDSRDWVILLLPLVPPGKCWHDRSFHILPNSLFTIR